VRSLASTAATAAMRIRPAHALPRASATERTCGASPPRPDPCPLPSLDAAHCLSRWARMAAQLLPRGNSLLPLPLPLTPAACTRHSQRGMARVRGMQGTRAGYRGRAADDRICDALRQLAAILTVSISALAMRA